MNSKQAISKQNTPLATLIEDTCQGFLYTIKGTKVEFEDVKGDGTLFRDKEGVFELDRHLEQTLTGLKIHTSIRNISNETAARLMSLESLNMDIANQHQNWINYS